MKHPNPIQKRARMASAPPSSSSTPPTARKFRFDSFATEFDCKEEAAAVKVKTEPKSDICDNDSGIGE